MRRFLLSLSYLFIIIVIIILYIFIHLIFLNFFLVGGLPCLLLQNGLSCPLVWHHWQRDWPRDSFSYCQTLNALKDLPPEKRPHTVYNHNNHLFFGQLNVEEVTNSMYCRLLVNFHILKSEKQCNSTFCPYYVKTFLELSLLQWVPELNSIAVSVFVVILVDFGKYQNQIQIIIWWWDQQACITWVLELPRPFQSFSGVPSTSHCRRGQAWTFWQRRWSLRWSREGWCWHCGGSRRRRSPSRSSSPG